MTKEEKEDEMKNRISMALKDPILQQGFEIICKENAELKEKSNKWFVFETEAGNWGMDKATQYTVDRHNYFYGTKEECQKWAVEHKIKDYTGHKYCYDRLDDQLTKAKEIIENIIRVTWGEGWNYSLDWKVKAEQFLNSEVEK